MDLCLTVFCPLHYHLLSLRLTHGHLAPPCSHAATAAMCTQAPAQIASQPPVNTPGGGAPALTSLCAVFQLALARGAAGFVESAAATVGGKLRRRQNVF